MDGDENVGIDSDLSWYHIRRLNEISNWDDISYNNKKLIYQRNLHFISVLFFNGKCYTRLLSPYKDISKKDLNTHLRFRKLFLKKYKHKFKVLYTWAINQIPKIAEKQAFPKFDFEATKVGKNKCVWFQNFVIFSEIFWSKTFRDQKTFSFCQLSG